MSFQLPGAGATFTLAAHVCAKSPTANGEEIDLGLEFTNTPEDTESAAALDRVRALIAQQYSDPTKAEGNP